MGKAVFGLSAGIAFFSIDVHEATVFLQDADILCVTEGKTLKQKRGFDPRAVQAGNILPSLSWQVLIFFCMAQSTASYVVHSPRAVHYLF